ncbi:MAG: hypothetical protein ACE5G3_11405, partial [Gammaproteobacteria bacterium]
AEVRRYVRRSIAGVVARLSPGAGRPVLRRFATLIAWGGVAAFVAGSNAVVLPVYYKLSGAGSRGADWESAAPLLEPWLADPGAIVMASPMQEPLFYYGRADIEFGPKYIYESDTGAELGVDGRTGLRVISTRESMELVFACHERGVLLVESSKWRRPGFGPSDDVLGFLELHARELPEAKNAGLTVFAWDGSSASPGADCSRLRPLDVAR